MTLDPTRPTSALHMPCCRALYSITTRSSKAMGSLRVSTTTSRYQLRQDPFPYLAGSRKTREDPSLSISSGRVIHITVRFIPPISTLGRSLLFFLFFCPSSPSPPQIHTPNVPKFPVPRRTLPPSFGHDFPAQSTLLNTICTRKRTMARSTQHVKNICTRKIRRHLRV